MRFMGGRTIKNYLLRTITKVAMEPGSEVGRETDEGKSVYKRLMRYRIESFT